MPDLNFPRVSGEPVVQASYNALPEHFQVFEIPEITPDGQGDHFFLKIRKRDANTHAVVQSLARYLGLKPVDIGYAGRKDKWAVTEQWFSVHAPKHSLADIQAFTDPKVELLEISKHSKKLRTGQLIGNRFIIQLTDLQGDITDIGKRAEQLNKTGWPNYFGGQRFGKQGQNLIRGERMLAGELRIKDRNQRSLYLSACRSYLFNCVLAERIHVGNWDKQIAGDVLADNGQVLGPLMGDGDSPAKDEAFVIEQRVIAAHEKLFRGIQNSRTAWQGRPFVIKPEALSLTQNTDGLQLEFSLPKGAYATVILQELIEF